MKGTYFSAIRKGKKNYEEINIFILNGDSDVISGIKHVEHENPYEYNLKFKNCKVDNIKYFIFTRVTSARDDYMVREQRPSTLDIDFENMLSDED